MKTLLILLLAITGTAAAQTLGEVVAWKFPRNPGERPSWVVMEDASGQRIDKWDASKLGPQPSAAQIAQWKTELAAERQAKTDADATEKAQLENVLAALDAGTATNRQVQSALANVIRRLLRNEAQLRAAQQLRR